MEAYARTHEEERVAQQQLEEDRKEEERMRRRLATREVERFRERVGAVISFTRKIDHTHFLISFIFMARSQ